jgi:hypothetical protein
MKQVVQDDNGGDKNDDDNVPLPDYQRRPPTLSVTKNIVHALANNGSLSTRGRSFPVDEDLVVFYLELLGKRMCRLSTVAAAAAAAVRWGYLHTYKRIRAIFVCTTKLPRCQNKGPTSNDTIDGC